MSAGRVTIRTWQDGDAESVAELLEPTLDPLWVAQAQQLHGPELGPSRFRLTRLAEIDGTIVGVGSIGSNPIHPGRYPAAIEVVAAHRRQGIGSQLLTTLMDLRPKPISLSAKIRGDDVLAMAFARAQGGRSYQKCDLVTIDPTLDSIRHWTEELLHHPVGRVVSILEHDNGLVVDSFFNLYVWIHEGWSPVGAMDVLREDSRRAVADLDNQMSVLVWDGNQIAAAVFAFRVVDGIEIVAETISRDTQHGRELLEHGLAVALRACDRAGLRRVEFDGHVTDPHLHPILASLPDRTPDPLYLMEFRD